MNNYDKALIALTATIASAIQDCKDELSHVDYESCIDLWERVYVDKLFEEYAVYYFIGRKAAGFTYEGASIKIEGHKFVLETIYNEVMKHEG